MTKTRIVRQRSISVPEAAADPTDLGDVVLWLDGKDPLGNGNPPSGGAAIPTWFDKSGNNFHFTALGTGLEIPTYNNVGFNGQQAVQISATQQGYMAAATFSTPSGSYTIFAVIDQNAGAAGFDGVYLFDKDVGGRLVINQITPPNGTNFKYFQTAFQLTGAGVGGEHVASWTFNAANGEAFYRNDFVDVANDTAYVSTPLNNDATLGQRFTAGGVTNYQGHIAEFIIYDKVLTGPQIASVDSYIQQKWGV